MASSDCQLTWDSYQKNICNGFSHLQQNEEFVDMTLAAEGHLVKVHKNLIALASPYLKEMIKSAPCQHPVIFLNHISHQTLSYILEYVYSGEVLVPMPMMYDFLKAAEALYIVGICDLLSPKNKVVKNLAHHFKKTPSSEEIIPMEDEFPQVDRTAEVEVNRIPEVNIIPDEYILPKAAALNNNQQSADFQATMTSSNEVQQTSADHVTNNSAQNPKLIASSVADIVIKRTGDNQIELVKNSNKRKKTTEKTYQSYFENSTDVHAINLPDAISNSNEQKYLTSETNSDIQYMDSGIININNEATGKTFDIILKDVALENTIPGQFNEGDNWSANEDINEEQNDYSHEERIMNLNRGFSDVRSALQVGGTNTNYAEPQSNNNYRINVELPGGSGEPPKITINGSVIETKPIAKVNTSTPSKLNTNTSVPTPMYTKSIRGSLQMVLNRYIYNIHHKTANGKRRWRCIEYRLNRCPAFVDSQGETLISRKFDHTHPLHDERIFEIGQRKCFFSSIKEIEEIVNEPKCSSRSSQNDPYDT